MLREMENETPLTTIRANLVSALKELLARPVDDLLAGSNEPGDTWLLGIGERIYSELSYWTRIYAVDQKIAGENLPSVEQLEAAVFHGMVQAKNERNPESRPHMLPPDQQPGFQS